MATKFIELVELLVDSEMYEVRGADYYTNRLTVDASDHDSFIFDKIFTAKLEQHGWRVGAAKIHPEYGRTYNVWLEQIE